MILPKLIAGPIMSQICVCFMNCYYLKDVEHVYYKSCSIHPIMYADNFMPSYDGLWDP